MGRVLLFVTILILLFGVFRDPILDGIKAWRTNDTTESYVVTTGAGETSANVTFSYDLYQAALAEVVSITSNITGETPATSAYYESSKKLTVAGLNAASTRTLGINYYAETEDGVMRVIGPFLSVIIFGGVLVLGFMICWGDRVLRRRR